MNNHIKIIEDLGLIYANENSKNRERFIIIECIDCQAHIKTRRYYVYNGRHKGRCQSCANKITSTVHGDGASKLNSVWISMKQRCLNKEDKAYKNYGGRGIAICDEWLEFIPFRDWSIANRYKDGLTLDRTNNNGNYAPYNCRWTTRQVQSRNSRRLRSTNSSGYRGVYYNKRRGKYIASITIDYKNTYIGSFDTAKEGGIRYDEYVRDNNLEHTTNFG